MVRENNSCSSVVRQSGWRRSFINCFFATLGAMSLFITPQVAEAQPQVFSIDWVQGRPEVPHPSLNGKSVYLQAIAEGGGCNGSYNYRWDLNGDGDFNDGGEGWRGANVWGPRNGWFAPLGITYTFPDQPGDRLFYPRVEARCSWGGPTAAVVVPYLQRVERICGGYPPRRSGHHHSDISCNADENDNAKLTKNYINDWGVDRALWWMFNRMNHYGDDGRGNGIHSCTYHGWHSTYSLGHVLNAFLRRSHGGGPDADSDVYYRHLTQCGLHALLGTYEWSCNIGWDDCARGRCRCRMYHTGARVSMGGNWMAYGSTAWSEPLGGFGNANYVSPRHGHNFRSLAQDVADGLVYCQGGNGGWYYSCQGSGPDGSTNGWAPEGLRIMKRKYDSNTYNWARDRQRSFLRSHCWNSCSYHGGGWKLGGNALVGWGWVREEDFDWNADGDQMRNHYHAVSGGDHYHWGSYYMYATTKGLRSWVPELTYMGQGNQNNAENNINGRDWSSEFAEFLMSWQSGDGSFEWCWHGDHHCGHNWLGWSGIPRETITALETQIVQTWLEAQALARATPQQTGPRVPVEFDHSWSYILDPAVKIVQYRWDKDSRNGIWWENGQGADFESERCGNDDFACQRRIRLSPYVFSYTDNVGWDDVIGTRVTLQIRDSVGRYFTDDKSVEIQLSLKNHKPLIVSHPDGKDGIYQGYFGQPMAWDLTTTWDADECIRDENNASVKGNCAGQEVFPGQGNRPRGRLDTITQICMDTNFNGSFCENAAETADVKDGYTFFEAMDGTTRRVWNRIGYKIFTPGDNLDEGVIVGIPVRACDDGRWNGKCYQPGDGGPGNLTRGDCSECSYGTLSVSVIRNVDPPEVVISDPSPASAVCTLNVDEIPSDEQYFDVTDHNGNTRRFVFDTDVPEQAPGSIRAAEGRIWVTALPEDEQTFTFRDHNGRVGRFIFDINTNAVDGTTEPVLGIDHIVVGVQGVASIADIAARIASAINADGALDTRAVQPAGRNYINLIQGGIDHSDAALSGFTGNAQIKTQDVQGVNSTNFVGGYHIGLEGANTTEEVAARIMRAINGANIANGGPLDITVSTGGAAPAPAQAELSFDGRPNDGDTFALTNAAGETTNFVFDHDSASAGGATQDIGGVPHVVIGLQGADTPERVAMRTQQTIERTNMGITPVQLDEQPVSATASLNVAGEPEDGETFSITNAEGETTNYVFRDDTSDTNGNTEPILGQDHVVIGIQGTETPEDVARRVELAITASDAGVEVSRDGGEISLTQETGGSDGNTAINTGGVTGVSSQNFEGGNTGHVVVLTQATGGTAGNVDIDSSNVNGMAATDFNGGAERATVALEQNANGLDGNSVLNTDGVSGLGSSNFVGGGNGTYTADPGSPLRLDFSDSSDPENVFGLDVQTRGVKFLFEVVGGDDIGIITPQEGFEGRPDNMGSMPYFTPLVDGVREVVIRGTATDGGGLETAFERTIQVRNAPPIIEEISAVARPNAPVFDNDADNPPATTHLGNHQYEMAFSASANPAVTVLLSYIADERFGEPLTARADFDEDGTPDDDAVGERGVMEFGYQGIPDEGMMQPVTLWVSDGEDTVDHTETIFVPPIDPVASRDIRFFLDVGNDGSFETVNSRVPTANFRVTPGTTEVRVTGKIRDGNGFEVAFDLGMVPLPNSAPRLQAARILSHEGFDVVVFASARDSERDRLTYIIDWGDGSVADRGPGNVYRHTYPREYGERTITVRAEDGRGGVDQEVIEIEIEMPELSEADVSSLTWTRVTPAEGNYDGIPTFGVDPNGVIFTHNYMDEIRRSSDDGANWETVLEDVECCGEVFTREPGQVFIASPAGLFYSDNGGDEWVVWDEQKFLGGMMAPGNNMVLAATSERLYRYDLTGNVVATWDIPGGYSDMDRCATNRAGITTEGGRLYVNDDANSVEARWRIPEDRFAKGGKGTSISFDKDCNLYQGLWNGYRRYNYPNGPVIPDSLTPPKDKFYVAGDARKNIYGGTGRITDILAWPKGPVLVGSERGLWAEQEAFNAYRTPFWKDHDRGINRSSHVREFAINPSTGSALVSTSSAQQVPKYCRKVRRGARRARRRGRRRGRVQYYYVFCGFNYNYYGGMYRSSESLLAARVVGAGGRDFDPAQGWDVAPNPDRGGLTLAANTEQPGFLWLVNTNHSSISKWTPDGAEPMELAEYRVGLPQGECPGQCCWDGGCNMPSRVGVDGRGDVYVASRGFGMQGTVTKIAARLTDCVDRNNNGRIDTSWNNPQDRENPIAANDAAPLDYGADECILWTVPVGGNNAVLRALTIDTGDTNAPDGYVWVGAYETSQMFKIDPATGRNLMTVNLGLQPYGAVVLSSGWMYVSTLGDAVIQRVNTGTGQTSNLIEPPGAMRGTCDSAYGIGVDPSGRIWLGGWDCPGAYGYNPRSEGWCYANGAGLGAGNFGRGITADSAGRVWSAVGTDAASYMAWFDSNQCQDNGSFDVPAENLFGQFELDGQGLTGPSAIGADSAGRIWLAHKNAPSAIVRVDPNNNFRVDTYANNNGSLVYSYSDFTGVVRRIGTGRGSYVEDFNADCENPTWTAFDWETEIPRGAEIVFTVYTAAERDKLDEATGVVVGRASADDPPVIIDDALVAANQASLAFVRIRASFIRGDDGTSPVLSRMSLRWQCN
jgi:streptogramin lyase